MRVLISGSHGFVGGYLTALARRRGARVTGLAHDVRDDEAMHRTIRRVRPDRIFHLAAQSFIPRAVSHPQETFEINTLGALHIFNAVCRSRLFDTRIHIVGSAYEYGRVPRSRMPIRETEPLKPMNAYAESKVVQDLFARQYFDEFGLHIVRTRAFSHIGPGQNERFAVSSFAKQIAMAEAGRAEPVLRVGNLGSVRDFTDVRDVVRAYWLLLDKGRPGEVYNVASGKGYKLGEILDILLGLARVRIRVERDHSRVRREDIPYIVGDNRKLRRATGWRPSIPIERTLADVLDDWRRKIRAGGV